MNGRGSPTIARGEWSTGGGASLALVVVCVLVVVVASADRPRPLRGPDSGRAIESGEGAGTAAIQAPAPLAASGGDASLPTPSASDGIGGEPSPATAPAEAYGCHIVDEGFGDYQRWSAMPLGRVLIPATVPVGPYDLVVHFHGAEAARKLLAPAGLGVVLAALDAGEGSTSYEEAFYGPGVLEGLLDSVRAAIRTAGGTEARLGRLVISSWSAGYGAVRQILLDEPWRPDAVVLLDSLHASYPAGGSELGPLGDPSLEPFIDLAQRASDSDGELWLTHSDIRPPGYASTTETAALLLSKLGAQRRYAGLDAHAGVVHKTRYDHGGLHIWGFSGTTRDAHCSQLRLLLPLLRDHVLPALGAAPSR